jgi:hypothetical protein
VTALISQVKKSLLLLNVPFHLVPTGLHIGIQPVLSCKLSKSLFFHDHSLFHGPFTSQSKKSSPVPAAYGAGGTNILSIGVHMGSSQLLPVFFANFTLSLAPVFFMVIASYLRLANGL